MSFTLLGLRAPGIAIADPGLRGQDLPRLLPCHRDAATEEHPSDRPDPGSSPSTGRPAPASPPWPGRWPAAPACRYLDTGAMYRSVAFAALRAGVDPDDAEPVGQPGPRAWSCSMADDGTVAVDGADATIEIRGPEVTRAVSIVAANPVVRAEMRAGSGSGPSSHGGGVMEGRDIGTVVFPDAALKVYLDANPEVRAARRSKEVADLSYETVASDLARRDALDQGREDSPLREADDAVVIDTSDRSGRRDRRR